MKSLRKNDPPKNSEWRWVARSFGVYYNHKVKRYGFHFKFPGFQWSQYPYYGWYLRVLWFDFAGSFA